MVELQHELIVDSVARPDPTVDTCPPKHQQDAAEQPGNTSQSVLLGYIKSPEYWEADSTGDMVYFILTDNPLLQVYREVPHSPKQEDHARTTTQPHQQSTAVKCIALLLRQQLSPCKHNITIGEHFLNTNNND